MPPIHQNKSSVNSVLKKIFVASLLLLAALLVSSFPQGFNLISTVSAANSTTDQSTADIQAKIDANNQKIADLQKQIDQYSTLLNSTSKEAQTLKNALANLELTQKKLQANLALTNQNISKANLTLTQLNSDIAQAETDISATSQAIAEGIRQMDQAESQSAIEDLLQNKSMSDALDYINGVYSLQAKMKLKFEDLNDLHDLLSAKKDQATGEKAKLVSYQKTLSDQQKVALAAQQEKDALLTATKNKESTYKAILADKVKQQEESQKELNDYESQLKIIIDPNSVPSARHSVLSWPLDKITVTQFFGYTPDAAKLYKTTAKHNGVDFRASIGTPVKAALSGTVTDTEPTKSRAGCQYGRYVLIKHPNGLSTIYGHLSVVSVKPGDTVTTGDIIGYSGDTGFATGPHLHFGLYVTSGIQIVYDSSTLVKPPATSSCAGIKTVAATPAAYLDPMAYLPNL